MVQLSKRLTAVAGMITPGYRLADVGTDHGYIPIRLVLEDRIPSAIAMDVNRGPLERARVHIREYGLEHRIHTRLSDGLEKLEAGEADTILIAGMGGMLTVRILENGKEVLAGIRELILQPQSDIRAVRRFLDAEGFCIVREDMVEEDGKFYPMLRAVHREEIQETVYLQEKGAGEPDARADAGLSDRELALRYGPLLLGRRHPVLLRYLEHERRLLERVRGKLAGETGEAALRRLGEITQELAWNEAARIQMQKTDAEGEGGLQ